MNKHTSRYIGIEINLTELHVFFAVIISIALLTLIFTIYGHSVQTTINVLLTVVI